MTDEAGDVAPRPGGGAPQIRRTPEAWRRGLVDGDVFRSEQARLRSIWTLIGLTTELRRDGDWIARDLWGHSVFVQRFGDTIKGFENRCAHRFHPVRNADNGNGPVRCGFHGWRYDQDGVAVAIPMCGELFGCTPGELNARLSPVEISVCGTLIFGRIDACGARESLPEYLGAMAPILETLSAEAGPAQRFDRPVAANWKLTYQITLDDYHIVAVHPSTFGAGGHRTRDSLSYFRAGPHIAMMGAKTRNPTLAAMSEACRAGHYEPDGYRIFHIFPNLVVLHTRNMRRWFVLVAQHRALAVDRTLVRTWVFPASFGLPRSAAERITDMVLDLPLTLIMRTGASMIAAEDNAVCARLQSVAHQTSGVPILGAEEERVAWFDEAYARIMAEG
ncbi:MAG TPA: SRPBCC family protein [Stellaceae bacterium]|nr:SRPBCC family protein [Stellaceae bacterium]